MAEIYGTPLTRRELARRVGDTVQAAGIERFTYDEGVQAGVQAARVRTGAGLDFTVLLSRGMDIGAASLHGVPFAWVSSTGWAHPHAFVPEERGWLQTFHGGLLTGCGMSNAGMHNTDGEDALGLHGRLSHLPAESIGTRTVWDGDEATLVIEGVLREATIFGENLRLHRMITAKVGTNTFTVRDTVTNEGFKTVPLMLLYHLNYGYPLVDEGTLVMMPEGTQTIPRDAVAEAGIACWQILDSPTPGYSEQCFFHDLPSNNATVTMHNPKRGFAVTMQWDTTEFPYCIQWKMMGEGEYVCGIEPANCLVLGRDQERAAGRLQQIEPGAVRTFGVTITATKEL